MARVDIYGLPIRTDRTDRKIDIRHRNCISLVGLRYTVRKLHLISAIGTDRKDLKLAYSP